MHDRGIPNGQEPLRRPRRNRIGLQCPVVEAVGGVPALDVRQLVGESLDRLRVADVRADPHGARGRVSCAVGLPAGPRTNV